MIRKTPRYYEISKPKEVTLSVWLDARNEISYKTYEEHSGYAYLYDYVREEAYLWND